MTLGHLGIWSTPKDGIKDWPFNRALDGNNTIAHAYAGLQENLVAPTARFIPQTM